jgi:hypothetical protein
VEAEERDGSDAADGAHPHFTGGHRQSSGTNPYATQTLVEMLQDGPAGNIISPPPLGIIWPPLKYQSPTSSATAIQVMTLLDLFAEINNVERTMNS